MKGLFPQELLATEADCPVQLHRLLVDYHPTGYLNYILGQDEQGATLVEDLHENGNVLVCGSSGSGKTVLVESMLASMAHAYAPDRVKFAIVNLGYAEMKGFEAFPHMYCPIATEAERAMELTVELLFEAELRHAYARELREKDYRTMSKEDLRPMPFIVLVIDELASLLLPNPGAILALSRVAVLGPPVGIHVVVTTNNSDVYLSQDVDAFKTRICMRLANRSHCSAVLQHRRLTTPRRVGEGLFASPLNPTPHRFFAPFVDGRKLESAGIYLQNNEN